MRKMFCSKLIEFTGLISWGFLLIVTVKLLFIKNGHRKFIRLEYNGNLLELFVKQYREKCLLERNTSSSGLNWIQSTFTQVLWVYLKVILRYFPCFYT